MAVIAPVLTSGIIIESITIRHNAKNLISEIPAVAVIKRALKREIQELNSVKLFPNDENKTSHVSENPVGTPSL